MKQTLVLASNNNHKIKEFKQIFTDYNIVSLNDIGFTEDIEETGETFVENALIKVNAVSKFLKDKNLEACIVADDSGLCVNALNGAPGVYSARYAGVHDDVVANRIKLLNNLQNIKDRSAYYVCIIVKLFPNGKYIIAEGRTYGFIADKEYGNSSFGYDNLFYSNDLQKTFGQATAEEKNRVSHRGRAIQDLINQESKKTLE